MTKRKYYAEKNIAVFLIIFGVVSLFVFIYGAFTIYDFALTKSVFSWKDISILKLVETNHSDFILEVLTIIGGLLVLLNKKSGWLLTLVTSITRVIFSLMNIYFIIYESQKPIEYKQ